ncbi:MAG: hypothetical protein AAF197_09600 [Pseudomonadota bacterium]
MLRKISLVIICLGSILLMSPLSAHQHADRGEISEEMREKFKERKKMRHEKMRKYMMSKIDTNQDGMVDYDEFMANAQERFTMTDLDGDGFITTEEQREARKLMREKHGEAMKEAKAAYEAKMDQE